LKALILKYGGQLSEFHECFTYQIEPVLEVPSQKSFFVGDVYSARWLVDSVKAGELLSRNEYHRYKNEEVPGIMRFAFGKSNVKYTIREAIQIFKLGLQNKEYSKSSAFWLQVERSGTIPKRTGDSLRNFWKESCKKGIENYMK
jgi:hypothetical protein